jgi:hypothetical protein
LRVLKAILSDWHKSKEFVEQDAELYRRSHRFNETHEQWPQIGRRGSFAAGLEGSAANYCPTNKPRLK